MKVYIQCYTKSNVKQEPRLFLEAMRRHLPRALPAEFHRYENRKVDFNPENEDQFLELWRTTSMFWSRRRGAVYGYVMRGQELRHTGILHTFDVRMAEEEEVYQFVAGIGRALRADYAVAHSIPNTDIPIDDARICSHAARLMPQGLPGVPWLAFYGRPYTELIGKKKLMTLPFTIAEEVGKNSIICRVTDKLVDIWDDRETFENHRAQIVAKMGSVFYDSHASCARRVPVFPMPIVR